MKALISALAFLLLDCAIHAQTQVKFCDLLRNPKQYDGQVVGTHRRKGHALASGYFVINELWLATHCQTAS